MNAFSRRASPFNSLAILGRAAAKFAVARLRQAGWRPQLVNWSARAEVCERCPLRVIRRGVSYCGKPLLERVEREVSDGCGCPTRDKARDPTEHCPVDLRHRPAAHAKPGVPGCNCKWCAANQEPRMASAAL